MGVIRNVNLEHRTKYNEIIQGDYRALYLTWLKAVDQVKEYL